MIEKMKITAKTVEEAIKKAADIWKIDAEKNGYTVIQEPSRGIFGIGSKDAIIEVNKNVPDVAVETPEPVQAETAVKEEEPVQVAAPAEPEEEETEIIVEDLSTAMKDESFMPEAVAEAEAVSGDAVTAEEVGLAFLGPIFKALNVDDAVINVSEEDNTIRFDVTGERVGILIGRHGETLNAIQFLMSLVINGKLENHRGVIFDVENYRERQAEKLENLAMRMAEKCRRTHRRVTLSPMNAAERRIIHITVEKVKGVTSYSEGNEPHRRVVIVED
ncbi:MAG: RNA-binding cell elongation regulator Jag/EloR [Peptococcaceae bacterium]|nr:RNA-binding cell elongation regulator Jag/EloR [Peptococcaceae bacterium]